jgi:AraC-like DNA-binding protein
MEILYKPFSNSISKMIHSKEGHFMKKEIRTICYDEELRIEAYCFEGVTRPFPNHFHEHYTIGVVEGGEHCMSCKSKEYALEGGDLVLLNPGENHTCAQRDGSLDFRGLNISNTVMLDLAEETTGKRELPGFSQKVVYDEEVTYYLRQLHQMVMSNSGEIGKEENLLLMISWLINRYSQPFENCISESREEVEKACSFIKRHYEEHIYLDQLCKYAGLSKSALLRSFTKSKGVTPHRYLVTIRINAAKKLLESGVSPVETAVRTGFSDQSHFTNFFNMFIGLPPGIYRELFLDKEHEK